MNAEQSRLEACIQTLKPARIAVIGDVMLDRYVLGKATRLSPEAPIQVLEASDQNEMPGGAANVASKAAELGADVQLIGLVGDDDEAESLGRVLAEQSGLETRFVHDSSRPTTLKTRFIAHNQQLLRVDRERRAAPSGATLQRLAEAAFDACANADAVILEDYGKGVLCPEVIAAALQGAKKSGAPVVVDPNGRDYRRYAGATVLTPNLKEAELAAERSIHDLQSLEAAAALLVEHTQGALAITREAEGISLFRVASGEWRVASDSEVASGEWRVASDSEVAGDEWRVARQDPSSLSPQRSRHSSLSTQHSALDAGTPLATHHSPPATIEHIHIPTIPVAVYDVTGAGDAVAATMAIALASGLDLVDACGLSNLAGRAVVRQLGVGTISIDHLLAEARGTAVQGGSSKVVDLATARRKAREIRQAGGKVVFTNGCFDILHYGHTHLLQFARDQGDFLVLGLNTDTSVRRQKGDDRPFVPEAERAHMLALYPFVDQVVLFDEDTPARLIEAIRPDVLVKGGDYTPETVVGREFIESYGGRVAICPRLDGLSTTNIVRKILRRREDAA